MTRLGWMGVLFGFAVVMAISYGVPAYIASQETVGTAISSARVITVDPQQPAYALSVRATVFLSPNCRRITHFALADATRRRVFPLGQIASGAGFTSPWEGEYSVILQIPPSIEAGDYALAVRAIYDCSWFGLFRYQITQQSPRVGVEVP